MIKKLDFLLMEERYVNFSSVYILVSVIYLYIIDILILYKFNFSCSFVLNGRLVMVISFNCLVFLVVY